MKKEYDRANELDGDLGFKIELRENSEKEFDIGENSSANSGGSGDSSGSLHMKGSSNYKIKDSKDDFGSPEASQIRTLEEKKLLQPRQRSGLFLAECAAMQVLCKKSM